MLEQFIAEVLTGRRGHANPDVRRFNMFSSTTEDHLAWWILCYIACILELFPSVVNLNFSDIMNDDLCACAASEEIGVDWELISGRPPVALYRR